MPKQTRHRHEAYRGVYYIDASDGQKIFYIQYKRNGKLIEEKAGKSKTNNMTFAKAARKRARRVDGLEPTNQERRDAEEAARQAKANKQTIEKLWDTYCETNPDNKGLKHEKRKFDLYLREGLGKKEPTELLPLDIDRLRLKLQKKGKRTQAARILELLRRTVNFGVKRGLVPPLPFKIEIPRLNNMTTEDLDPKQLKKLLDALDADEDNRVSDIMRLALFTGMRRGEILKLKWTDIDRDRNFITLVDPKGGPDQKIPLSDPASDVIGNIKKTRSPYLFPGRFKGEHLKVIPRKSLDRIKKASDLPKGFRPLHGLRHVFASMLASSGQVDMYTLQKLLTHKSPLMTQRYAHLHDEALKRASGVAADLISEAIKDKSKKKKSK